jgi:hypothetical protein
VEVADHGLVGKRARGGLVDRRQVMQVEQVGVGGTGPLEMPDPGLDEMLVSVVVDIREHAVGRPRAVLERRVHRRIRPQRIIGLERLVVGNRDDVEALEEGAGVGVVTGRAQRARQDRGVPPVRGQRRGKVTRHLCGAPAREEHQAHQHAAIRAHAPDRSVF